MMQRSSSSFFGDIRSRELHGRIALKSLHLGDVSSDAGGFGAGVLELEHDGFPSPPLAVSFGKTSKRSHILMVSDEEGYMSLYDTRRRLPSFASCRGKRAQALVHEWVAHNNAILDVCWIKDDTRILSASGDTTIKIWDAERAGCIGTLKGHNGTVRSVCSHSSNPDLLVSGSRDGSFALWDIRCKSNSTSNRGKECLSFTSTVKNAHTPTRGKRGRQAKTSSMSVTSVLYLKDEVSIASAGTVDSMVKFWDTRNLQSSISQVCPCGESSHEKERCLHGISCLSQDPNGVFLAASCMDNRIYMYNVLQLNNRPDKIISGSIVGSFYVKMAISPDGAHILGGSSDHNAYIWQVNNPDKVPVSLKGHEGEVTAVDWCSSEVGKLASASDDNMIRVWNFDKKSISTESPSSIRKRVAADPSFRCRKLVMDAIPTCQKEFLSEENMMNSTSPVQAQAIKFRTPESGRKRSLGFGLKEELEMKNSPEASTNSPSSVLSPPSSLKRRTIRDYFVAP